MDATVSARIPVETKKQADKKLRSMGSSATELINAAYNYVLSEGALPTPSKTTPSKSKARQLSPEKAAHLKEFFAKTTFTLPEAAYAELNATSYKDMIAEGRRADYEALA